MRTFCVISVYMGLSECDRDVYAHVVVANDQRDAEMKVRSILTDQDKLLEIHATEFVALYNRPVFAGMTALLISVAR